MIIKQFRGEYNWLSNFALVDIVVDDKKYKSVEMAYMSCKSGQEAWKQFCINGDQKKVKYQSRFIDLPDDWDVKKIESMKYCIDQKFNQEPYKTKLLQTINYYIQEGNTWGDRFWGVDLKTDKGLNLLGMIIMEKRAKLHHEF